MRPINGNIWSILVVFMLFFISCDDELLTGDFTIDPCAALAEPQRMRANIGNGVDVFDAEIIESPDNTYSKSGGFLVTHANGFTHLNIGGLDTDFGIISMDIINPEVGFFDLATSNETGYVSNENDHALLESLGHYSPNAAELGEELPFVSFVDRGGSGQVEITKLDLVNQIASGKFNFIGNRVMIDPETGDAILDANGDPIIETIEINCGSFDDIHYELLINAVSTGPFYNDFYAKVDNEEFVETSLTVERAVVNTRSTLYIKALTAAGELMRIDVPIGLGVGTFAFEPISDGSKLTALYNNNNGAESLTANPGTITILEYDEINGVLDATFAFTGTDPFGNDPTIVEVTEGAFKVSFFPSSIPDALDATVDGTPYETNSITVEKSEFLGRNIITVSTITEDNQSLALIFPKNIEVGSYNMSPNVISGDEKVGLYSPEDGIVTSLRSNPGTLTILSYDLLTGEMEGTFEFEALDILGIDPNEYSVTSGSFSILIPR